MVSKPPTFSPQMQAKIGSIGRIYSAMDSPWKTAVLAGYEGSRPNKSFNAPTRQGSNPNSTIAQLQRTRLSLQGEEIIKNTAFGRNYVNKRRMYCSSGISWHPDTGDAATNKLVTDYVTDQWKRMGVNSSMQQTFALCADAFLPQYGDCALRWIRSEEGNPNSDLRLLAITGDRIGEIYRYVAPVVKNGITYYCGLYFDGPNILQYKIYERWYDTTYIRPENVDAADIIFFIDDISGGVRGVSLFSAAVDDIRSRHEILKSTKDTMQQQSKMAAIASNNSGSAPEYSYDTQVNTDGTIEYQESYADGAVVKYQFNGDSYQVLRAEHPSQDFIGALRYLDANGSLACGFPYEFLFSGAESGGAPFRGAFEAAGREIERLRNDVHRPRLDVIAYVTIMDGVERGLLPAKSGIARGSWQFTTLPSADAFRDAKSDIDQIRAGITSPQRVIAMSLGTTADAILSETKQWAMMVSKTRQDANKELLSAGYKGDITAADIAQVSDNPMQAQQGENLAEGKPTNVNDSNTKSATVEKTDSKPAAMADHDVSSEKRADDGKWTSGGGGGSAKPEHETIKSGGELTRHLKKNYALSTDEAKRVIQQAGLPAGANTVHKPDQIKKVLDAARQIRDGGASAPKDTSQKAIASDLFKSGTYGKTYGLEKTEPRQNVGGIYSTGGWDFEGRPNQDFWNDWTENKEAMQEKGWRAYKDGGGYAIKFTVPISHVAHAGCTPAKQAADDHYNKAAAMAEFDESKHPRAKDGEFAKGGGGGKKSASPNEPAGKTGEKSGEHKAEEPHRDKPDGGSSKGANPSHVKLTNSRVLDETDKALKVKVNLGEGSMPIWIPKSHASVSDDGTVHAAQWVLDAKHKEFDTGFNPDLHGEQIQTGNPLKPPTPEEIAQREAESQQWMKEAAERNERNQKARSQKAAKKEKELTPEQIASRELEVKKQASIKTSRRNAFAEAQADYFANKELPGKENAEKRKAKKEEFLKDPEFVKRQLDRLDSGLAPRGWEDAVIKKAA